MARPPPVLMLYNNNLFHFLLAVVAYYWHCVTSYMVKKSNTIALLHHVYVACGTAIVPCLLFM